MEKETKNINWERVIFVHDRIVSAVKRVDRKSFIVLKDHWCHIIVVNVHAPSEEKSDDSEERNEELEQVCDHFLSTILKCC